MVSASTTTGRSADLYWVVALRRDKSCGRVAEKFGLRAWTINLRTWIFGLTRLVFKTTCIDRGKALREGAFSFTRTILFPPRNQRNTRDKVKGLRITSERHIWELGVRCLSTLSRGQDSPATVSNSALPANNYCFSPTTLRPATRAKRISEPTNKHAPPTALVCRWGVAVCLCGLSVRVPSPARGQRAAPSAACPRGRSRRCGGHGYR